MPPEVGDTSTATLSSRDLLDAFPSAVVVVDPTGVIIGWNTAAEVLYGYRRRDVLGTPAVDLLFDEDERAGAAARFAAGTPWEGQCRVRRRDGRLLASSFRMTPAGEARAWIATDGVDQGLAEQERAVLLSAEHAARANAEETLNLLEAIVGSAPVAIAVFDLDLRYVRVNHAYAALSGVPADEHQGGRIGTVIPLQIRVVADLRRVTTTGRSITGQQVTFNPGGRPGAARHFTVSYFPVRGVTGALVGAGLAAVEITDLKRAEAERSALLARAEAAQQRLSILSTASAVLATTMELDELVQRLTAVLTPEVADWCLIGLVGDRSEAEQAAVSYRDPAAAQRAAGGLRAALNGEGVVGEVLRSGQPRLIPITGIDGLLSPPPPDGEAPAPAAASGLVVPVGSRGRVAGVLALATDAGRTLGEDDLDLAVELAHRAALAVENARVYQQEHRVAETLQRALLPPGPPVVEGLELGFRYLAATDGASVGGDWYDVLDFDDGTTGVVVGDVVGHDITATTAMGQLRSALRAYAFEDHESPAATLARLDRQFAALGLTYASCLFGIFDRERSRLRWSNAGHPPPLLIREGTASFLTEGAGLLLGVAEGDGALEASTSLRPGDVLVLYSDGLVERPTASLSDGLERLAEAAAPVGTDSVDGICDRLLEAMIPPAFARRDDIAILVVRVGPGRGRRAVRRMNFGPGAGSAHRARGFTDEVLRTYGWAEHVDRAVLLVSELVTNAVRHAPGAALLTVAVTADAVEVSVEDREPLQPPELRHAGVLDEGGRGLVLVEALAARWGMRITEWGKAVWFVLTR